MKLGKNDDKYGIDVHDRKAIWIAVYAAHFERLCWEGKLSNISAGRMAASAADMAARYCDVEDK